MDALVPSPPADDVSDPRLSFRPRAPPTTPAEGMPPSTGDSSAACFSLSCQKPRVTSTLFDPDV